MRRPQPPSHVGVFGKSAGIAIGGASHRLQMRLDEGHAELLRDAHADHHASDATDDDVDTFAAFKRLPRPSLHARRHLPRCELHRLDEPPLGDATRPSEHSLNASSQRTNRNAVLGKHWREVRGRNSAYLVPRITQAKPQCDVGLNASSGVVADKGDAHVLSAGVSQHIATPCCNVSET